MNTVVHSIAKSMLSAGHRPPAQSDALRGFGRTLEVSTQVGSAGRGADAGQDGGILRSQPRSRNLPCDLWRYLPARLLQGS